MRRTFRKHPWVQIKTPESRNLDFRIGAAKGGGPGYCLPENIIYLNGAKEEEASTTLVHEVSHWAVFGFFTVDESIQTIIAQLNWMIRNAPRPPLAKLCDFIAGEET